MSQREINDAGLSLVKSFEGLVDGDPGTANLDPYMDPIKIWTIGWGHVVRADGRALVGPQDAATARAEFPGGISTAQAEALLRADLLGSARDVSKAVAVPLSDNEFSALVSFTFNVGAANFRQSTLLRKLNDSDRWGSAEEFARWVMAGGKRLDGLVRRRQAERDLFVTP
jgi:lysozyme